MQKRKSTVTGNRPLIYIGYKYNYQNVFSFIPTENTGTTKYAVTYLFKYSEQFYNAPIIPVDFTLVVYKFFGNINEVDSHKKNRQSDLALEKHWVTQCGYL